MQIPIRKVRVFINISSWQSSTIPEFLFGCVCSMGLGFLMLSLPFFTERALRLLQGRNSLRRSAQSILSANSNEEDDIDNGRGPRTKLFGSQNAGILNPKQKAVTVFMYFLYAALHVIVMIIIMAMNAYVILAIIIGATLGDYVKGADKCSKKIGAATKQPISQQKCCHSSDKKHGHKDSESNNKIMLQSDSSDQEQSEQTS